MAAQITTYAGLKAGMLAWLARPGDALLDARFDDFLLNCERRMYYGHAVDEPNNVLRSDPLRIVEMEVVDPSFSLTGAMDGSSVRVVEDAVVRVIESADNSAAVPTGYIAQPRNFLELIAAQLNGPNWPLQIVSPRVLDGYGARSLGGTRLLAVSGKNFRFMDAPGSGTATLRYYQKLETPGGSTVNDILANYPDVYLYGCLAEAAIFTQGEAEAQRYLQLYNASVAGLNARTQRITASANPVIRVRAGMVV
jgi:hypothetical protein